MRGLLIKDLRFILQNKKMMGVLLFVVVAMLVTQGPEGGVFVISYMTLLCGMMVLNTISMDEFDKSDVFLMTMPIERKTYAAEKYIFALLCSFCGWLAGTVSSTLMQKGSVKDYLVIALVLYVICSFFQMLILPIQLKFGGDKGRMVLMGVVVFFFVVVILIKKVGEHMFDTAADAEKWADEVLVRLESLNPWSIALVVAAVWIAVTAISFGISKKIMEKKEY